MPKRGNYKKAVKKMVKKLHHKRKANHEALHWKPSKGLNNPLPQEFFTEFISRGQLSFLAASAIGKWTPGGNFATTFIPINICYQPLGDVAATINSVVGRGLGVTSVGESPAGFIQLTGIYSCYTVTSSSISMDVDIGNVSDEGRIMIAPIVSLLGVGQPYTSAQLMNNGALIHTSDIDYYTGQKDCHIGHSISVAKLFGVSKQKVLDEDNYSCLGQTGAPQNICYWQIGYACNSGVSGGQNLMSTAAISFTIKYRVRMYNIITANYEE